MKAKDKKKEKKRREKAVKKFNKSLKGLSTDDIFAVSELLVGAYLILKNFRRLL